MQIDLDPARSLLDTLSAVVETPALDEAEPQDTESSEVVDADAGC